MAEISRGDSSSRGGAGAGDPANMQSLASHVGPQSYQQRDPRTDPKNIKEMLADLSSLFHDFDDPATYRGLVDEALSQNTANFAVRFGVEHSEIATNLNSQDMRTLLQTSADKKNENVVTWM